MAMIITIHSSISDTKLSKIMNSLQKLCSSTSKLLTSKYSSMLKCIVHSNYQLKAHKNTSEHIAQWNFIFKAQLAN